MQGKERNHDEVIDEQFIDQSWASMSQVLDQEMPVKKSSAGSKRYGLLLLLLFVGFVAGIGASYYYLNNKVEPTPSPKKKAPVYAGPGTTETPNNTLSTSETLVESTSLSDGSSNRSSDESSTLVNKSNQTDPLNSTVNAASKNNLVLERKEGNAIENNVQDQTIAIKPPRTVVTENSTTNLTNNKIIPIVINEEFVAKQTNRSPSEITKNDNLSTIKNETVLDQTYVTLEELKLPLAVLPVEASEDRTFPAELSIVNKKASWRLGAIGGAHYAGDKFGGWSAGLIADYQLSPRWSFETGLNFTSFHKNVQFDLEETDVDRAYAESITYDENSNLEFEPVEPPLGSSDPTSPINQEQLVGNIGVQRLNYVNVPMLIAYQPNPALRLIMGLNAAFRLNNFTAVGGGSRGGFIRANMDQEDQSQFDFIFEQGLRKIDLSGVCGIRYFPLSKTAIDLRYNYGITDFSRNDIFKDAKRDINQSLQLSLVHYFGR